MKVRDSAALGIALAITLSAMAAHGWIRARWDFDAEVERRGAALANVPDKFGGWERKAVKEVDENVLNQLECEHYFDHVYFNQTLDATVEVAVFFGSAGPIAVHTPDVCYRHSDYKIVDTKVLDVGEHQFNLVVMERKSVDRARIHVCFAWLHADKWEVADSPRFAYAFKRHLYKMQMVIAHPSLTPEGVADSDKDDDKDDEKDEEVGVDASLTISFLKDFAEAFEKNSLTN